MIPIITNARLGRPVSIRNRVRRKKLKYLLPGEKRPVSGVTLLLWLVVLVVDIAIILTFIYLIK